MAPAPTTSTVSASKERARIESQHDDAQNDGNTLQIVRAAQSTNEVFTSPAPDRYQDISNESQMVKIIGTMNNEADSIRDENQHDESAPQMVDTDDILNEESNSTHIADQGGQMEVNSVPGGNQDRSNEPQMVKIVETINTEVEILIETMNNEADPAQEGQSQDINDENTPVKPSKQSNLNVVLLTNHQKSSGINNFNVEM